MAFLVGLSIILYHVLRLLPLPVLYGIFLYIGVASLYGVQVLHMTATIPEYLLLYTTTHSPLSSCFLFHFTSLIPSLLPSFYVCSLCSDWLFHSSQTSTNQTTTTSVASPTSESTATHSTRSSSSSSCVSSRWCSRSASSSLSW